MEKKGIEKIIVVFKTHLDVGFTGFAADIVQQYNKTYIPRALEVGKEIINIGRSEGFTWTTGSWLIYQYLQQADEKQTDAISSAIEKGIISWHALPFTMHSEYAGKELYEYGLSLSLQLDKRFGKKTTGAKNTDVPGHTRAIVPLLQDAGVEFLHIGVNPASTAPDVPGIFRWKDSNGKSIIVMYNSGDYGEFTQIPGTGTAVYFAHTGDNHGPQDAESILAIYDKLHKEYPTAEIKAGDLSDVANAVEKISDKLPVISGELGDTWIHGTGTDPQKTSQFRALLRFAKDMEQEDRNKMYEHLLMVPEHTWGLDEKTFLNDHNHFERGSFEEAKSSEAYKKMEQSWDEQRAYISCAVNALSEENKAKALESMCQYKTDMPDLSLYNLLESKTAKINGWDIEINGQGAVVKLQNSKVKLADEKHPLGLFRYEAFSEKEVLAYGKRYMSTRPDWALEDFGKIGLDAGMEQYYCKDAQCINIYANANEMLIELSIEEEAYKKYGCPAKMFVKIKPTSEKVCFDFSWFNKNASRIPEALWLGFNLPQPLTAISKLGSFINPMDVISLGNREMHATDGKLLFNDVYFYTYDASLLAVGKPYIYGFYNKQPDTQKGVWINLFNNQWGTNFPMWSSGDARFRFSIGGIG